MEKLNVNTVGAVWSVIFIIGVMKGKLCHQTFLAIG